MTARQPGGQAGRQPPSPSAAAARSPEPGAVRQLRSSALLFVSPAAEEEEDEEEEATGEPEYLQRVAAEAPLSTLRVERETMHSRKNIFPAVVVVVIIPESAERKGIREQRVLLAPPAWRD